jgi:hypothetical protein
VNEHPGQPEKPAIGGVAGSLLADLEAGGELVDEGGFSIDAAQARKKLRDYLLADAHAYVLLLIEAAVLGGAEPVRVKIDGGALELELGPITFAREELEELFAAVFVDLSGSEAPERRRRRALQKLAYACNAALRLELQAIVIDSGAWRLRLTPARELGELEELAQPVEGTRVRIEHGMLARVTAGELREVELIRSHCRFAPMPIDLDEERISGGLVNALHTQLGPDDLSFSPRARRVTEIELAGEVVGLAGLRYSGKLPAEVTILTNGVLAETFELGLERPAAPDFAAIINVDLPKDLGQNKLLRGPEFDAVMAAIWAVHDRIAPAEFGEPSNAPEQQRQNLALGLPLSLAAAGAFIMWLALDPRDPQAPLAMLFGILVLAVGGIGVIAAVVLARKQ